MVFRSDAILCLNPLFVMNIDEASVLHANCDLTNALKQFCLFAR